MILVVTHTHLSTHKKVPGSRQISETYGITNYGSGWRKDVVNQSLEFVFGGKSLCVEMSHSVEGELLSLWVSRSVCR